MYYSVLAMQPISVLGCLAALFWLKLRLDDDLQKRLAASRSHKELRRLRREIDADGRGKTTVMCELLGQELFPPVLSRIQCAAWVLAPLGVAAGLLMYPTHLLAAGLVSLGAVGVLCALCLVYRIVEGQNARRVLPQLEAEKAQRFAALAGHKQKPKVPPVTLPQNRRVLFCAWLLRYGIVIGALLALAMDRSCGNRFFLTAFCFLLDGAVYLWQAHTPSDAFLCAMQSFSHQKMTPGSHAQNQIVHDKKEGRRLGIVLLVLGIIFGGVSFFL